MYCLLILFFKLDHWEDHIICEILSLKETVQTPLTSMYLLVVACLEFKTDHTQNMLLDIDSVERYM